MTDHEALLGIGYVHECLALKGDVLYWADRPPSHFSSESAHKVFQGKYAGKPAGRRESNGYITINMRHNGGRVQLHAHRVVWMLHKGNWPENVIDHINQVRSDNRIENLRDVTTAKNLENSARRAILPGAYPFRDKFQSSVRVGRKHIALGLYDTPEEANAHYEEVCAAMEKVARSMVKKGVIGRPRKERHQTFRTDESKSE